VDLPCSSLKSAEAALFKLGTGERLPSTNPAVRLLLDLGFVQADSAATSMGRVWLQARPPYLTEFGDEYYNARFVLDDPAQCRQLLTRALLRDPVASCILQELWGHQPVGPEQLLALIKRRRSLPPSASADALGGLLYMLNHAGLIKYSKRDARITVLYNPHVPEEEGLPDNIIIAPESPYTNVRWLRQILRACRGSIMWFDKHFERQALEPLSEVIDANLVGDVTILSSNDHVPPAVTDFKRLQQELANKGVRLRWFFKPKADLRHEHDRWIVADNVAYNVPPVRSLFKGQLSELNRTDNVGTLQQRFAQLLSGAQEVT
jgi:hypothetical protein